MTEHGPELNSDAGEDKDTGECIKCQSRTDLTCHTFFLGKHVNQKLDGTGGRTDVFDLVDSVTVAACMQCAENRWRQELLWASACGVVLAAIATVLFFFAIGLFFFITAGLAGICLFAFVSTLLGGKRKMTESVAETIVIKKYAKQGRLRKGAKVFGEKEAGKMIRQKEYNQSKRISN